MANENKRISDRRCIITHCSARSADVDGSILDTAVSRPMDNNVDLVRRSVASNNPMEMNTCSRSTSTGKQGDTYFTLIASNMKRFAHGNDSHRFVRILDEFQVSRTSEHERLTPSGQIGLAHLSHRGP